MRKTLRQALRIDDIRHRLFYTFLMLIVVRLGSQLPIPGVNPEFIQQFFAQQTGDALNFFNAFTGGSFEQMSVFALSISPYITSSIIMQLLTIAIPKLEELQKDGEEGRKKIQAYSRYVTILLAVIQATAMTVGFGRQGLLIKYNAWNVIMVVLVMTAGSAFLMWMGERITEKGIGNGISIILLINILSRIPSDFRSLFNLFITGKAWWKALIAAVIILAVILFVVVFVILLQDGERKIAVQYSQKVQGRRSVGGQSSHIPLKVNTAGVIPVIFASSLMQFPIIIASFIGKGTDGCDADLEAIALGVHTVHTEEIGGEQSGLLASRTRPKLHDDRAIVLGILGDEELLQLLGGLGQLALEHLGLVLGQSLQLGVVPQLAKLQSLGAGILQTAVETVRLHQRSQIVIFLDECRIHRGIGRRLGEGETELNVLVFGGDGDELFKHDGFL